MIPALKLVAMKKLRTILTYVGIYTISAGDSVRYALSWAFWGFLIAAITLLSGYFVFNKDARQLFSRVPKPLWALLALMPLSVIWSNYPLFSLLGILGTAMGLLFALFLIKTYNWRELLNVFANTMRFILWLSIAFELFAALVVRGPIDPIFKNFQGSYQTVSAYRWTVGKILTGHDRIQGIVGNANLLGYVAMLGLIFFLVQYATRQASRWVSISSILVALYCIYITRSANIMVAVAVVILAAVVMIVSEGRDREGRHRIYRVTWTAAACAAFTAALYSGELAVLIGKNPDLTGRSDLWAAVWGLIQQRPVFGWGWISYWMPGAKPLDTLFVQGGVTYYQAHNIFLDFWLQLGAVGLLLFIAVIVITFVKLWRLAIRSTNPIYLWPVFVLIGLVIQNLFESRLIVELGWVLMMILVIKSNQPLDDNEPDPELTKVEALKVLARRITLRGWGKRSPTKQS